MSKIIGYCRVSTKMQVNGNGLASQRIAILNRYDNAEIFEESYTGTKTDRPI